MADVVESELREVVRREFRGFEPELEPFLAQFTNIILPKPEAELLARVRGVSVDLDDVLIAAAAVQSAEIHKAEYLLSNDFENFHTPAMKAFLLEYHIEPISLYGLL